jgi:excisionase family DNA binding protein
MRDLLTVREFAQAVRLSEETIRRRCERGEIRGAFRVATGPWRIPRNTLEQLVAEPELAEAS